MAAAKKQEQLNIAVTFTRPKDKLGPTGYQTRISAQSAPEFAPDEVTRGIALEELQKRGFSITSQGKLSVSIRGKKADFEKHFGTKLSKVTLKSDKDKKFSADSVYYPKDGAPWKPVSAIKRLIDDAYIQWPHVYMNRRFENPDLSPIPPNVKYFHLAVPGDVAIMLNAARVHRQGYTGKGVRVAMIDTGFAHSHPYFREMGYNSSIILAPGANHKELDNGGHGTGESANVFAIAPDVSFIGIKLNNEDDPYQSASILEGFQEALKHHPDIISVSMGYDLAYSNRKPFTSLPNNLKALEAEIAHAVADGIVVVFSSGNGHVAFPGMMPEVISAGGVFIDQHGAMMASDYASAFTSKIYPGRIVPDFCGLVGLAKDHADYIMMPLAPECKIDKSGSIHDGTGPKDGWGVFSGTSAAAPQIAGACALLKQKNPGLTPAEIKSILSRTSRDVIQGKASAASNANNAVKAGPGNDGATGAGLVNIYEAWKQV